MIYLNSYRPLALYPSGRSAARRSNVPPYVDYSCRREPDLESVFPSITALCRKGKFAPKLNEGDIVVYISVQGRYPGRKCKHYRLPAVLEVIKKCCNHEAAANWYRSQNIPLPHNCMVAGNPPVPLSQTAGFYYCSFDEDTKKKQRCFPQCSDDWDSEYEERKNKWPAFLVCRSLFLSLHDPPAFTKVDAEDVFIEHGRVMPATRTPPRIRPADFYRLMKFCGTGVRVDEARHQLTPRR